MVTQKRKSSLPNNSLTAENKHHQQQDPQRQRRTMVSPTKRKSDEDEDPSNLKAPEDAQPNEVANGSSTGEKEENCSSKKKTEASSAKKPRVSAERAQEVANKILAKLAENYSLGAREMPIETLAVQVGYKNPRSDAILAAMKIVKDDQGLVSKSKNVVRLTDTGIEQHVEEEKVPPNPEAAMDLFWSQLEMKLDSNQKTKGEKPKSNARSVWDLLQDGKGHSTKEVLKVTTYGMERSTGFPETIKALTELGFAVKENKRLRFTDKVYPYGRPE